MPRIAYYRQDCPTCGRNLRIRVEYLGRSLCCPHCRGKFMAADPSASPYPGRPAALNLLDRANELLESVHLQRSNLNSDWAVGATRQPLLPPDALESDSLQSDAFHYPAAAPRNRPPELN